MKRTVIGILLVLLLLTGHQVLAQQVPVAAYQQTDSTSLEGTWILVPVLASDTATGKRAFIHFSVNDKKFTGFTGCNRMNGSCMIRGNALSFSEQIVTTRMLCEGYNEKDFIANLLRTTSYKITDGVLTLMADQTPLSRWTRKETKPGNNTL